MSRTERLLVIALDDVPGVNRAAKLAAELGPFAVVEVASRAQLGHSLRAAVQAGLGHYVLVVLPDEPVDGESVETTIAALERAPEAVLGSAGLLWRPPALTLDISTRERSLGGGSLHEGRRLGRLLALRAVTFPSWSGVVMRTAALGTDLPRCEDTDEACIATRAHDAPPETAALLSSLTIELLLRGSGWSGQHLGYAQRSDLAVARDVTAWAQGLGTAERLGLLEQQDDLERATHNLRHEAERAELGHMLDALARPRRPAAPSRTPSLAASPATVQPDPPELPAPISVRREWPLRRFLIAAGDFDAGSAGLVALHMLCDRLNRQGYDATIAPFTPLAGMPAGGVTNPGWLTPLATMGDRFERTVAVYPEIVPGNPLESPWVVRWLLNRPGLITGVGMDAGPNDLIVTWSDAIDPGRPVLNLPLCDLATYFPKPTPGEGRLLWVGKGKVPHSLDRTGMTEITRSWPRGRTAMASLLRSAELLVSCDWLTSLTIESILCGTPVAFAGVQEWSPGEPMDPDAFLGPGAIVCPDGTPTPGQLARATAACAERRASYLHSVARIGEEVDGFVSLVNEHFDRVATHSLAAASA